MKSASRSGLCRVFPVLLICPLFAAALLSRPGPGLAASWQWSAPGEGREQIVIRLDPDTAEQSTVRSSHTSIDIQLSGPPLGLDRDGSAPGGGLVSNLDAQGNVLRLHLADPAFGYIVQRRNGSLILEIFQDPLGARWQPSDSAVIPPSPEAQATAPVQTPAQTPAQTPVQNLAQAPGQAGDPVAEPLGQVQGGPQPPDLSPAQPGGPVADQALAEAPQTTPTLPETGPILPQPVPLTQAGQPAQTVQADQLEGAASVAAPQADGVTTVVEASPGEAVLSGPDAVDGRIETITTTTGQGQIIVPPTTGRDVRIVIPPGEAVVADDGPATPVGMPGGERGAAAPLAVASGGSLPVQADPPAEDLPSATDLGALTQRIESVPVQDVPQAAPAGALGETLLSTPAAPPPDPSAARDLAAAIAAGGQGNTVIVMDATGQVVGVPEGPAADPFLVAAPPVQPYALADPPVPDAAVPVPPVIPVVPEPPRVVAEAGNALRARINPLGPEAWPEEQAVSSGQPAPHVPPASETAVLGSDRPAPGVVIGDGAAGPGGVVVQNPLVPEPSTAQVADSETAQMMPAGTAAPIIEQVTEHVTEQVTDPARPQAVVADGAMAPDPIPAPILEPEVIYVDEEGNPVPPPLDVNAMIAEARQLILSLRFGPALDILEQVRQVPLPPEKREEVLYLISDAITGQYNGRWLEGYEPIVASTSEAMNANLRSPQVARALERLGMINLRTGNQQDAEGYFAVLRRQFPHDPQVPDVYYALGMDQLQNGQYAEAVQNFQLIMQEYPESNAVRLAARFMAEALYRQGHYERALTIIDFVDRRWPRIYLEDPSYLLMVADTQFRRGRLEEALQTYWIHYNLLPDGPTNDQQLLNMGTIYLIQGDMDTATALFSELLRRYPDSQYAPLAVLRQGEEGIFEGNLGVDELFAMFARPNLRTLPEVAYERLQRDYPDTEEAVTASLRLAAWRLWNREYATAMAEAERFIETHPDSPYASRADEIILRALAYELAMDLEEQNYERILSRWERFPQMRGAYAEPNDELRVALARAHINRGNEAEGFALLEPFLHRPKDPKYGEYVYKLNLARALRTEDWRGIVDLGELVQAWDLPQEDRNQLVYAMAIARENMQQGEEAVPLWGQLYTRNDIPLYQKAYANYFMARDAERRRSIAEAYNLNRETLELFRRLGVENPERSDPARIQESLAALMDVTEVANRFAEALEWADEYAPFVPDDSPEYAAYRFRLARLHRKMGDLIRWQYLLEDIIAREPDTVFGQMAASELRTHQVARDLSRFAPDS